jgi:peptidoglycan/LPS O-acetylase OafA/YrhL
VGLLRTLLALSVVFDHAAPAEELLVGGQIAVQCFYIMSGFLISYILVERGSYASIWAFYVNRYLRLYPIYFVVAMVSLIAILATHRTGFAAVYEAAPPSAIALLVFANVFLFGMDWIMFCGVINQKLVFLTNFADSDIPLYQGQIIHPAWTLGVELTFYLLAPFILPRRRWIWFLLAASVALRIYFLHLGFGARDPWSYRFFPTELALFLFGALAHQILLPAYRRFSPRGQALAANVATVFLMVFCVVYALLPLEAVYKRLLLYAAVGCLVPLTFLFQQKHRFDGWIGDLSYPIYICHTLVLWICTYGLRHLKIQDERMLGIACAVFSVAFAICLNWTVAHPFERVRNKLRAGGRRGTGVSGARAQWRDVPVRE